MKKTPSIITIWVFVALLALIWGSTWLAIKFGLQDAPPFYSASLRFIIALLVLYGIMKFKGLSFPKGNKFWKRALFLSVFMFIIPYGFVYWGEMHISAGLGAVLFSTQSLFVVLISQFLLKNEKANIKKWLGIIIGLFGLTIIFNNGMYWLSEWGLAGMICILIASVSNGFAIVWLKRKSETIEPLIVVTSQVFIASLAFIIISLSFETFPRELLTLKLGLSAIYLGVIGTAFSFIVFYWLTKHTTALIVSFSLFTTPIFAIFLGWFFLNETMDLRSLIGVFIVILSIVITQLDKRNQQR